MRAISYGGGNNSKAMVCELVRRGEPIDVLTMADPGSEWPHTYRDVWTMSEWLVAQGYPAITVVRNDGMYETLERNCLAKRMIPSIGYGFKTCSDKYKIRPQEKYLASLEAVQAVWAAGETVERCIGYHADEAHRATVLGDKRYSNRFPLIEWRMGQQECLAAIRAAGLEPPGKSACTFCPSSTVSDVLRLKRQHPELLAKALAMEATAAPNLLTVQGLGRRWAWRDLVDYDDRQGDLFARDRQFPESVALPCACYDGDDEG